MRRATLARIIAQKLRLVATAFAIVVGVAFVTGTLVFSDTLNATFTTLFAETTAGIDLVVQGRQDSADPITGQRDPVPTALADMVAAVDGVAVVAPEVRGSAELIGEDGQPVGGIGPPTSGINAPVSDALTVPEVREGRFPEAADEVAIDAATAAAQGLEVGEAVDVVLEGPVSEFTLVGTVGFGEVDSLAGATLVVLEPEFAFATYGATGYTLLNVIIDQGADVDAVAADIASVAGGGVDVATRAEAVDQASTEVAGGFGFITTALQAFAGVALFVGAFLIANTFSIIVAQRTRELALLRAVGASRWQVMGSVLAEAAVTGVVGSIGGFALGVGLARGLYVLLGAFGLSLPQGDLVVTGTTFLIALVLGVVVTLVSAVVPAARSTRVPPVAALQAVAAPPPPRYGRVRYVLGAVVFVAGIAGIWVALSADAGIASAGGGAVVSLIGAALLAPLVTRPLLAAIGAPLSATRGIPGQLATENSLSNPRRTAATASALMIGLALVSFIAIMGSSFTQSVEATIGESFAGDFQVNPVVYFTEQRDPGSALEKDIAAVEGVDVVTALRAGMVKVRGQDTFLTAFDADVIDRVITVDVQEGGENGLLADGGLAVSSDLADSGELSVGDAVEVVVGGTSTTLALDTIYEASPVLAGWAADVERLPDPLMFGDLYIDVADEADPAAVREQLDAVLEPYPTLVLRDLSEIRQVAADQVNQALGLVTALLGLSVVVALFGIVNTLGLSVFERIRELGLLRAVGASRAQVRSMIRWEAVLIALLGAIFGLVIGVLFAWVMVIALSADTGLEFAVPAAQLIGGLVASALAGVLAAIIPARRASRIDVLRALEAH